MNTFLHLEFVTLVYHFGVPRS